MLFPNSYKRFFLKIRENFEYFAFSVYGARLIKIQADEPMTPFSSFENFQGQQLDNDPLRAHLPDPGKYTVKNLNYCTLNPNLISDGDFLLSPHKILWNYWQSLRGAGDIAIYDQIDPMEFNRAIGFVLLLEPNKEATDFRYRVYGSSVAERFGQEMTGKWLSDFGDAPGKLSLAQYPIILANRIAVYSEHDAVTEMEFYLTRWCRLILPMQNRNGAVDRILVGAIPIEL